MKEINLIVQENKIWGEKTSNVNILIVVSDLERILFFL